MVFLNILLTRYCTHTYFAEYLCACEIKFRNCAKTANILYHEIKLIFITLKEEIFADFAVFA